MDKKLLIAIIIVFVVMVISAGAYLTIRLSTPKPESIKIGWPTPITGQIASFGEPNPWVASYVTKIVNEQMGGIYLDEYGKKIPIEIIIRDTKSDPEYAATVAEDLIVNEKVDLIVVLHTSDTTIPVSAMCEKYEVPCVAFDTPVISWLSGGPYEWSYLHFWSELDLAQVYVGLWDQVREQTNNKAGALWHDDPDSPHIRKLALELAKDRGYDFVGDQGLYPLGTTDFSPYIKDLMEKDVELVTGQFPPPDFSEFWKQCNEMGYHPKVVTVAKALLFPAAVDNLGSDLADGLTTEVWSSKYHPGKSLLSGLSSKEFSNLWEIESGKQMTPPLFYSLGALETALDVVERSGSLDKVKIRNALADTDVDTIVGRVSFKAPLSPEDKERFEKWPELIKYADHYSLAPVVGGQWRKGEDWPLEIQIVYNWKYDQILETSNMILLPK